MIKNIAALQLDHSGFSIYLKSKSNMVMNAIVVVTKYSLGHSALFGDIVTSLLEMKINHQLYDRSLLTSII